jgi:hypothetical protein
MENILVDFFAKKIPHNKALNRLDELINESNSMNVLNKSYIIQKILIKIHCLRVSFDCSAIDTAYTYL